MPYTLSRHRSSSIEIIQKRFRVKDQEERERKRMEERGRAREKEWKIHFLVRAWRTYATHQHLSLEQYNCEANEMCSQFTSCKWSDVRCSVKSTHVRVHVIFVVLVLILDGELDRIADTFISSYSQFHSTWKICRIIIIVMNFYSFIRLASSVDEHTHTRAFATAFQ